ncbi:MAG: ABC transporter permease [Xanthobacteraceae bacterium]
MTEVRRGLGTAGQRLARDLSKPKEKAREAPIVPKNSISGRALVAVIAIMTFLASLTVGAVTMVLAAASEWQSDVAREVTIQVRLVAGKDIEQSVRRAVEITQATPGVISVRPLSKEDSGRLLEPWLGTGISLDSLPVPRLIVVQLASDRPPDLAALRETLAVEAPGASLDDHRGFVRRLRAMSDTAMAIGLAILALVFAATVLSVSFATRGAMATNRATVEVLHLIGAKDSYIAGQFQRHFLFLGLEGGAIGGGAAIVVFIALGILSRRLLGQTGSADVGAVFGGLSLGLGGYAAVILQVLVIAAVTALASRHVVKRTLETVT